MPCKIFFVPEGYTGVLFGITKTVAAQKYYTSNLPLPTLVDYLGRESPPPMTGSRRIQKSGPKVFTWADSCRKDQPAGSSLDTYHVQDSSAWPEIAPIAKKMNPCSITPKAPSPVAWADIARPDPVSVWAKTDAKIKQPSPDTLPKPPSAWTDIARKDPQPSTAPSKALKIKRRAKIKRKA